jgi:hypothetical protein
MAISEYALLASGSRGGFQLPQNLGDLTRWLAIAVVGVLALKTVFGMLGGGSRR